MAGARIIAYAAGAGTIAPRIAAVSDVDGRFELAVPGGTTELRLIVAAAGGTLAFRIPSGAQRAYLTYQGVILPFPDLAEWARAQNTPATPDGLRRIPRLAPGTYRLCAVLSEPGRGEQCRAGVLAAAGTLELQLDD